MDMKGEGEHESREGVGVTRHSTSLIGPQHGNLCTKACAPLMEEVQFVQTKSYSPLAVAAKVEQFVFFIPAHP
eukprot:1158822-Pelagomonas_calceolata.AAC.3